MYVIVGLGNPDKKYEHTRHNIGFDVIDALADKYNISVTDKKHKALCGSGVIEGMKVLLVKPQTYMNLSRIKVGVGEKPQGWDLADHVLGRFSSEDRAKVEEAIGHAMDAAVLMMQGETDKAMNIYN